MDDQDRMRLLVERNVGPCFSRMFERLIFDRPDDEDLLKLTLCVSYEDAARDDRTGHDLDEDQQTAFEEAEESEDWQTYCQEYDIEPFEHEIFEHWIVDERFARRLLKFGEAVVEIEDLWVWGRTTTGQAICMDYVIEQIARDMEILGGQKYEWKQ